MRNWLTPEEIAQELKVTDRTVRLWLQSGKIPAIKLGRVWRVDAIDLAEFLSRSRHSAKTIAEHDREILSLLATRIREHYPEAKIWAFGSRSRGEASTDSDFDVCVVLPEKNEADDKAINRIAWEVGFDHDVLIMVTLFSRHEFNAGPMSHSPLISNILREGIAA